MRRASRSTAPPSAVRAPASQPTQPPSSKQPSSCGALACYLSYRCSPSALLRAQEIHSPARSRAEHVSAARCLWRCGRRAFSLARALRFRSARSRRCSRRHSLQSEPPALRRLGGARRPASSSRGGPCTSLAADDALFLRRSRSSFLAHLLTFRSLALFALAPCALRRCRSCEPGRRSQSRCSSRPRTASCCSRDRTRSARHGERRCKKMRGKRGELPKWDAREGEGLSSGEEGREGRGRARARARSSGREVGRAKGGGGAGAASEGWTSASTLGSVRKGESEKGSERRTCASLVLAAVRDSASRRRSRRPGSPSSPRRGSSRHRGSR